MCIIFYVYTFYFDVFAIFLVQLISWPLKQTFYGHTPDIVDRENKW